MLSSFSKISELPVFFYPSLSFFCSLSCSKGCSIILFQFFPLLLTFDNCIGLLLNVHRTSPICKRFICFMTYICKYILVIKEVFFNYSDETTLGNIDMFQSCCLFLLFSHNCDQTVFQCMYCMLRMYLLQCSVHILAFVMI